MPEKTEQERLEELLRKYPEDKYFQVFPRLILGWRIPDFVTFAVEVISVDPNPDNREVYWQERPKKAYKDRPDDEGWVSLTKGSLDRLALAMGMKWLGGVRLDDGRDPDRMIWEQRGALVMLTGIDTFAEAYELNLKTRRERFIIKQKTFPPKDKDKIADPQGKWREWQSLTPEEREEVVQLKADGYILQIRDSLTQRVQTGAKLRVIRSVAGLPSQYRPSVLRDKKFAILKLVLDPKSEAERLAYLGHLAHAGALTAGYTPQGHLLQAPASPSPSLIGSGECLGDPDPHEDEDEALEGIPEAEVIEDGEPGPEEEAAQGDGAFLADLRELFRELARLTSKEGASALLATLIAPAKASEDIKDPRARAALLGELRLEIARQRERILDGEKVKAVEQQAGAPKIPEASPPQSSPSEGAPDRFAGQPFLAIRHNSLKRMSIERLNKELDELTRGYPASDPAGILSLIQNSPGHDEMVEATIRVIEWKQTGRK